MTVAGWLILTVDLGIGKALVKRISEGAQQGEYFTAAVVCALALAMGISIATIFGRPIFESYITEFDQYVAVSVVYFIVVIIFVKVFHQTVFRTLNGEHKVHIAGLFDPVKIGGQSLIQIGLVFLGYGLFGMLVGSILSGILVGLVGLIWVTTRPAIPAKRHLRSLFDYAKFSWLGNLKHRAFNEVDILLLSVSCPHRLSVSITLRGHFRSFLDCLVAQSNQRCFPKSATHPLRNPIRLPPNWSRIRWRIRA
jgi:O-antigen/teichoic acid export membrane protein